MGIKSFSFTLIVVFSLTSGLAGCKSAPKVSVPNPIVIPPPPPPTVSNVPVDKPEEKPVQPPPAQVPSETKKVALILGPGGAKALAHVGVLKALQQQRVPIGKVIGLEWGALIAGLYANKGQVHDVEWKLYKMEQQNLPMPKNFLRRSEGSVKMLEGYFTDAFGSDDVSAARVGFACPSRSIWSGVVTWQNRGSFKDAMKRCLTFPPVLTVQGNFIAGASQASEAVEQLTREGYGLIVLVNVLGSAMPVAQDAVMDNVNNVILWQEVKRALMETSRQKIITINVDTSAYPMVKFDAKKELIQLGESVGQRAAYELVSKFGF